MIGQPVTVFYDADGDVASTWEGQLTQSGARPGHPRRDEPRSRSGLSRGWRGRGGGPTLSAC